MKPSELTPRIPDYLDRDALLQYTVFYAKDLLRADGCSIFLKEANTTRYTLRESTVLTKYVGKDSVDVAEKELQLKRSEKNIGLTFYTIHLGTCLNVPCVNTDEKWSFYGREGDYADFHCELPPDRMGSFIAVPLRVRRRSSECACIGVIRLVSERLNHFGDEDEQALQDFSDRVAERIDNALSFSELIDTGAALSLEDLCQKVVEDVRRITVTKGCTIFLVDENSLCGTVRIYRPIASTGLHAGSETYDKERGNLDKAFYEINTDPAAIPTSLTEYAIKNSQQIVIDDIYSEEEIARLPRLDRRPGPGRFSEYETISPARLEAQKTGAMIFSPIFSRDKYQVIGLIRLNKPRRPNLVAGREVNDNVFNDYEKRLFSSYVDKLGTILRNITLFQTLDEICTFTNKDDLFSFVVKAATKIVGGRGCSVLMLNPYTRLLDFMQSYGELSDRIGQLRPYEIGEGWTGWVGKHKRPLMFNHRDRLQTGDYGPDRPAHSGRFEECESGSRTSEKFLAVPFLRRNGDLLGVLRVPKIATDSDFTELDVKMLESLGRHVALAIENIETFAKHIAQDRVIRVYSLGALLEEQDAEERLFHIFLTGLTHGDAIGFNRAILFEFDRGAQELKGKACLGPAGSDEGRRMRRAMEENRDLFTLQKCIEEYDKRSGRADDLLRRRVSAAVLTLEPRCKLLAEIERNEKTVRRIDKGEYSVSFSSALQSFLESIDADTIWAIVLPTVKERTFVVICDNVYDHKDLDASGMPLLDIYLNLVIRALRSLFQKKVELLIAREAAWQEISAMAAHRLGQFLPIIEGRIWDMKQSPDRVEPRSFWEETFGCVLSAKQVVADLRFLAGGIRLDVRETIQADEVLRQVVGSLSKTYSDVQFKLCPTSSIDKVKVFVDMMKLKEAVEVLVKNTLEAKARGVVVEVGTAPATKEDIRGYNLALGQDYVVLSVRDNGPGIRPDLKEKCFQPFFTTKPTGTGLGLAIAQRIVQAHRGKLVEEGVYGEGAFFKAFLPVRKESV